MAAHRLFFYLFLLALPTQLGKHFWPAWSYIWGLKIDYLSPTLYLSDILLGLTLVSWIAGNWSHLSKWTNWKNTLKKPLFVIFYIATLLYGYVAYRQVAFPQLWLYKLVKLVELILLAFYVAKTTRSRADLGKIFFLLAVGAVFESFLAVAQFARQVSLGGIFWWLGERTFNQNTPGIAQAILNGQLFLRPYATFPHPNALAGYLLVILILAKISQEKFQIFPYLFRSVFYPLISVAFLLTFSRSAWATGIIILFVFLLKKRPKFRPFFYLLICLLIFLFVIFAYLFIGSDPYSFAKRWQLSEAALFMIKSSPLVGVGLGHFILTLINFPQEGQVFWLQPVHNIYLLITAETGLIGFGIFFGVLWLVYKRFVFSMCRLWRASPSAGHLVFRGGKRGAPKAPSILYTKYYILLSVTAILLTGLFDHYWLTLQQNQLLFALILGLSLNPKNYSTASSSTTSPPPAGAPPPDSEGSSSKAKVAKIFS